MNKRTLSLLVSVGIVVLALVVWLIFFRETPATNTNSVVTNTDSSQEGEIPESTDPIFVFNASPDSGPAAGGQEVTLVGSGFLTGAKVFLGDREATNVSMTEEGTLTLTTPQGEGTVNIRVVNPDGRSGIFYNSYTYN